MIVCPSLQIHHKGQVNKPRSSVKVNGNPARVTVANEVEGGVDVVQGNNTIEAVTRDYHEQSVTNWHSVSLPERSDKTYQYDDSGDLVTDRPKSEGTDKLLLTNQSLDAFIIRIYERCAY